MSAPIENANDKTRQAWNTNAAFWDAHMGDTGNDFVNVLQWPSLERLLPLRVGTRLLDIACGNGVMARRMARHGASVVASDFAAQMVELARGRTSVDDGDIRYHVVDATDEAALRALGEGSFDGALANMALFDMAEVDPLFRALMHLLKPGGVFVFTLMHPCFNNPYALHTAEKEDREGNLITTYAMRVLRYMTPFMRRGLAIRGQPEPQIYFHRPLHDILGRGLAVGFVIDALEERAFAPEHGQGNPQLAWNGNFSEFPPVMVVRMRKVNLVA